MTSHDCNASSCAPNHSECQCIVEQYYEKLFKYCCVRLRETFAAEECTQEVFLTMLKKQDTLDFQNNIRGWLYATADRVILAYQREKQRQYTEIPLETALKIVDHRNPLESSGDIRFDCLTDEEYQLLSEYYSMEGSELHGLAQRMGLTYSGLYKRIQRIRQKLIEQM